MKIRLKEFRKKMGISQEQLAEMLMCGKSHVSEMESGKKNPSGPMLDRMAALFGVSPADIFDVGDEPSEVVELIQIVRAMDGENLRTLLAVARSLKEQGRK